MDMSNNSLPEPVDHNDQKRLNEVRLEANLLQGLESPANVWTSDDVDRNKTVVRERLAAKQCNI